MRTENTAPLTDDRNNFNLGSSTDPRSLRHFTTIRSGVYPKLFDHINAVREVQRAEVERGRGDNESLFKNV